MAYIYYLTQRPASIGTQPDKGLISVCNFSHRQNVGYCEAWAKVVYDRKLTEKEVSDYELSENLPPYKMVHIPDLWELAVEALMNPHDESVENKYKATAKKVKRIYEKLFDMLRSGKIDFFYYDCVYNENNFNRYVFTRSCRNNGVQKSCIWYKNGEEIPMSDCNRETVDEFWKDHELSNNVDVFYGVCE